MVLQSPVMVPLRKNIKKIWYSEAQSRTLQAPLQGTLFQGQTTIEPTVPLREEPLKEPYSNL